MSLTKEQLEIRQNMITASRLPAIFGKSEYVAPIDVYNAMVYGESGIENVSQHGGSRHERAVLEEFAEQMECKLDIPENSYYADGRFATFVYPEKLAIPPLDEQKVHLAKEDKPQAEIVALNAPSKAQDGKKQAESTVFWFADTPDAIVKNDSQYLKEVFGINQSVAGAPVQAKCVGSRKAAQWGESQFGEPPESVILQVMGDIIGTRAELKTDINFGFVVALIGEPTLGDYRFYCVHLDADTEKYLLPSAKEFWYLVQRRDVSALSPEGNWKPYFQHAYPRQKVESIKDEDGSFGVLWKELRQIRGNLAQLESAKDGLENTIKLKMRDAGLVFGDPALGKNGALFSWKATKDGTETNWEKIAKAFLTKRNKDKFEKIVKANTKPVPGSRRFCIKGITNGNNDKQQE